MDDLTFGQKAADFAATHIGSWAFLILFNLFIAFWIGFNLYFGKDAIDPAPFIGLNLLLSWLAGVQAPLIMISQNRQDEIHKKTVESIDQIGIATYEITRAMKILLEDQNKLLEDALEQKECDHE